MNKNWLVLTVCCLLLHCAVANANEQAFTLNDCHLDGIKEQVKCGSLTVPENYQQPDGAKITINLAVIPAIDNSEQKAPFMFLAGGPGQAAVALAAPLRTVFREIRKTRDLILVDQRGTGKSHPLACDETLTSDVYLSIPESLSEVEISNCINSLSGNLSQYSSENAIRDFEAVRVALGHPQLNLYGGSYGTRAALVYLRMFPQSIRSVVLDSVGPIEVPIGLFGQSAARSFNLLLEHCRQEASCQQAFPNLGQEFEQVVQRLEKSPARVSISHPRLGNSTEFVISKGKFIGNLRMQLYSVQGRSLVPLVIHQAYLENYLPLAGLVAQTDGGNNMAMSVGLTFNIVCNEDLPKMTPLMIAVDGDNNFGKATSHLAWQRVCPLWPQYRMPEDFYQPVTANVPTLIFSGNLDPVTPPSNGEFSAKTLPNSHHIIVKNAAHTVAMHSCAPLIINEFLTTLAPKDVDASCLDEMLDETFMISLNGSI